MFFRFNMFHIFRYVVFSIIISNIKIHAFVPTEEQVVVYRQNIEGLNIPRCLAIPEGAFVYFYNSDVKEWLQKPFNVEVIKNIRSKLAQNLEIPLTKEGFSAAATRKDEEELDVTSYSAIWVRDCCWNYYGLKLSNVNAAKELILSLLDFYSSEGQISRFLSIIKNPKLSDPDYNPKAHMDVPLIRFSGKTLEGWKIEGKDQEWNHIQFDSHGLFLLALSDALNSKVVAERDLKLKFFEILALFPAFFTETDYAQKKDGGPWEEELLLNASSAGLVASGQKRIMEVINNNPYLKNSLKEILQVMRKKYSDDVLMNKIEKALSDENIENLYQKGINRVEKNINLGGEAPCLDGKGIDRKADAALLFLCIVKHAPYYNNLEKIKQILNINSSLIGPYGIYRYKYDAYQSMNYWINYNIPSAIFGDETLKSLFITRFKKGYMPHQHFFDAQWFFDSNFAIAYYRLVLLEKSSEIRTYYLLQGDIHLKRALAQLTGNETYAANGEKLEPWQLPESINTFCDQNNGIRAIPSPICPLNWAKAALLMALNQAEIAHYQMEK